VRFFVEFAVKEGGLINLPSRTIGLTQVDMVREKEQLPNLPLDVFSSEVYSKRELYALVEIDEETARRAAKAGCLFLEQDRERVVVSGSFNNYCNLDYEAFRAVDGKIHRVCFSYQLNKKKLIENWENAGFPKEWELESVNKPENEEV